MGQRNADTGGDGEVLSPEWRLLVLRVQTLHTKRAEEQKDRQHPRGASHDGNALAGCWMRVVHVAGLGKAAYQPCFLRRLRICCTWFPP